MPASSDHGPGILLMRKFSIVLLLTFPLAYGLALGQDTGATRTSANQKLADELASIKPEIISRDKWGAKPAGEGLRPHNPIAVILHHTGVAQNAKYTLEQKMRGLQNYSQSVEEVSPGHVKSMWPDVPYHFYIDMAGSIAEGRNVNYEGDTNTAYDPSGYIQIVLEGDFEKENPGKEQLTALEGLLVWLMHSWNISNERLGVHLDHAQTDCPGKNFISVLQDVRLRLTKRREALIRKFCEEGTKPEFNKMHCRI